MLREAFLNTFYTCGIVAGIAATLVIVKWSWGYLFARKADQPVKIEPIPPEPVPIEPIRPEPEQKMFVGKSPQQVAQALPVDAGEPQAEAIECGNCGREIKSPRDKRSNPTLDVYECEHCGTTVGIRVV